MDRQKEREFYNAVNAALQSSYSGLSKIRRIFPSWEDAFANLPGKSPDPAIGFEELEKRGVRLILREDPQYPPLLHEIPFPPFGIYVRGNLPDPKITAIAIVGTRKARQSGKQFAFDLAETLSQSGCSVVSGLSFGIDAASHRGSLHAEGRTYAVLANGLNTVYPASHISLAEEIIKSGGGIISETAFGVPTLPYRFLQRNRIISGLSRAVVVVEAPKISGALATARFATEQNREVFAVPGDIRDGNFEGSNRLLRQGAQLITSCGDLLEELGISPCPKSGTLAFNTPEERIVFEVIKNSLQPLNIDKIVELTKLNIQAVNQTAALLVIKNAIKENERGFELA
jgi:DNA processing protein